MRRRSARGCLAGWPCGKVTPVSERSIKSGLYWRKSLWNGAATVPVVLTAEPATNANGGSRGTLTMRDADGRGFSVDADRVTATWSRFGTMTLTVDGTRYDVVGAGSRISKSFSPEQRAELEQAATVASDAGSWNWASAGLAVGSVGKVLNNTKPWKTILPGVGAKVV